MGSPKFNNVSSLIACISYSSLLKTIESVSGLQIRIRMNQCDDNFRTRNNFCLVHRPKPQQLQQSILGRFRESWVGLGVEWVGGRGGGENQTVDKLNSLVAVSLHSYLTNGRRLCIANGTLQSSGCLVGRCLFVILTAFCKMPRLVVISKSSDWSSSGPV